MRIIGFGTCMINGYGVGKEFSFFNQGLNLIKNDVDFSEVISLGGFPINRATKYLDKKVIELNPDLVILQFGNVDLNINIEKKLKKIYKRKSNKIQIQSIDNSGLLPFNNTFKSRGKLLLKFLLKNIFAVVSNTKPTTPINIYISYLEQMIRKLNQRDIKVIVLSPFATSDFIRDRRALKYINNVKLLKEKVDFEFVDCFYPLKKYDISQFLLDDGVHLSRNGHMIVASEVAKTIDEIML